MKPAKKTKSKADPKKTKAAPVSASGIDVDEALIVKSGTLSDLVLDLDNANAGTKRGRELLERSLENYGAGRSVLLDKNNRVIAGNKTIEAALEKGFGLKIVETTGETLIAVKRKDLDLERDKSARELAYADNRVNQVDLLWDADRVINDLDSGLDLSSMFDEAEIDAFRTLLNEGGSDLAVKDQTLQDAPASGVRVVQLFFNELNYPEFIGFIETLADRYGTQDITATVFSAVEREAATLAAPTP